MTDILKNPKVRQLIYDLVGGCKNQTATILEMTIVQIYTADEGKHKFHRCNIAGILCFLIDRREGKCFYLRVYDPLNLQVLFSMELCYGIKDFWQPIHGISNFQSIPIQKQKKQMLKLKNMRRRKRNLKNQRKRRGQFKVHLKIFLD
ncbi:unnamed protein product [Paramecium sonneborni]|uniref:Uncharacterized protein n=1 Tax=Paramecium sonneborni TaxID=65129 RepID=A0A8S1NS42_9CILI|nr:unnamed protein product [Paramecium sonneborni]